MVAAMPVNSLLDVQTNDEGAVRTTEVKSKVMKDAVPISTSAVHPSPVGPAQAAPPPPAFDGQLSALKKLPPEAIVLERVGNP
jgi:hypothetical protein